MFLNHENQSFPASLSDDGMLLTCLKSLLVPIFEAKAALPNVIPSIEVIIIDGSALVNDNQPRTSKMFEEYAIKEFASNIQSYASKVLKASVKVFTNKPEFRILRLTFHRKSASKC